jgi:hypothetical protein
MLVALRNTLTRSMTGSFAGGLLVMLAQPTSNMNVAGMRRNLVVIRIISFPFGALIN